MRSPQKQTSGTRSTVAKGVAKGLVLAGTLGAGAVLATGGLTAVPTSSQTTASVRLAADSTRAATSLAEGARAAGRTFGVAVQASNLGDAQYTGILDAQFSAVSPENDMKWEVNEPQPGVFDFTAGDAIVARAAGKGMIVRGHTMVWHQQVPAYVTAITDAAAMQAALDRHITGVAAHYEGQLEFWDVVNEAFDDDGTRRDNSPFQQVLGDGYVEAAFEKAREADGDTKLCYNDFNIEGVNAKSDAVLAMVTDFKARGVPIDCVGFQSHFVTGGVPADLEANIRRFTDLGVSVQISELDIRMELPATPEKLAQQAEDYQAVIGACLAVEGCDNITVWQVSDRESWVPSTFAGQGAALLFDENRAAKPAFDASLEALG